MFVNWRVYSGFIFLLQSLRIPLAILLVSDIKFLDDYFLIISTSIPAQFFAAEVLTYRGISFKKMSKNEIITIFTIIMTIFYFLILHSITLTIIYVLYIFSILVLFYTTYFIRKIGGGEKYLKFEMGINLIWTFIVLISIILFDNKDVSYYILSGMIVFNILISLWVYFRNMHLIKNHKNTDICTGYGMQINIMITTQLERMLIGIIFPTFLGVISIVASICQGWRKIVLDDAILFERLTLARNVLEVTKNHFWFYAKNSIPMLMLLFFSLFFTDNLNMLLPRNLDSYNLIYLGIIYMIALPAGIVTINLIRSNIYSPSIFSYSYTILVMSYLSVMLIISKYISIDMKYVWLIISSTAMINIVLYIDFLFTFKDKK